MKQTPEHVGAEEGEFDRGRGRKCSFRANRLLAEMFLVALSDCPPSDALHVRWHVSFRKQRRALRLAQSQASSMCRYVSVRWCISVYEVDPSCWPDDWETPVKRWRCATYHVPK